MATALDSIKRAMRLLGVYAIGEEPSADEAAVGLTALNAMLDAFANDRLVIYAPSLDTITWTPSAASRTVGPSGGTITTRPVQLLDATYFEYLGVSYPLTPLTLDEWNGIGMKATASTLPQFIYYEPSYPNATVYLYPVPTAAITLKLYSTKQLQSIPALTTTLDLPPGYQDFIDHNLAERLAPEFQVPVPPAVAKHAALTRKAIARTNYVPQLMDFPGVALPPGRFNIFSGMNE